MDERSPSLRGERLGNEDETRSGSALPKYAERPATLNSAGAPAASNSVSIVVVVVGSIRMRA